MLPKNLDSYVHLGGGVLEDKIIEDKIIKM